MRAVRNAGGHWVGSFGSTYVPGYAAWYRRNRTVGPDWESRLAHWEQWTADISTSDIIKKKPDIILVRDEEMVKWPQWIKKYSRLSAAMSGYRFYGKLNVGTGIYPVEVYVRKSANSGRDGDNS